MPRRKSFFSTPRIGKKLLKISVYLNGKQVRRDKIETPVKHSCPTCHHLFHGTTVTNSKCQDLLIRQLLR